MKTIHHITSDLAGVFASLSRMASCFIRDTEAQRTATPLFVFIAMDNHYSLVFVQATDLFFSVSLCLCGGL